MEWCQNLLPCMACQIIKDIKKVQLLLKIFCPHSGSIRAHQPLMLDGSLNPTPQNPVASEIISLPWLSSKTHPSGISLAGPRLSRLRQKSQWLCCNFGHSLCFTSQPVQRCKLVFPEQLHLFEVVNFGGICFLCVYATRPINDDEELSFGFPSPVGLHLF